MFHSEGKVVASTVNSDEEKHKAEKFFQSYVRSMYDSLKASASGLSFGVFEESITGYWGVRSQGISVNPLITVIDFDKVSSEKRLWVLDLAKKEILFHTLVAHGKKSGEEKALYFSNKMESNMSSLGFYLTGNTYCGKHGLSLVLQGLDKGYNCNAEKRNIVMHGASYVCDDFVKCNGRLGRSLGCPAVPYDVHDKIIDAIKNGSLLYIHRSSEDYRSDFLNKDRVLAFLMKENFRELTAFCP